MGGGSWSPEALLFILNGKGKLPSLALPDSVSDFFKAEAAQRSGLQDP